MTNTYLVWADFKVIITTKGRVRFTDRIDFYKMTYADTVGVFETTVAKDAGADQVEFETYYKPYANKVFESPINQDKRIIVHSTPRKIGTFTCFTGAGDDQADYSKVGGSSGAVLELHHEVGDSTSQSIYIDFNTIANETHAHAGHMMWKDALNDLVTLETVPKLTTVEASTSTNYNLYGGYLVVPAAGDGTINVTDMVLVEVPINEFGNRSGAGYWDADYNSTTKLFENVAPNLTGTGQFNMFTVEIALDRFINRMPLLGSGFMALDTYDASQMGHNMRLRITLETRGTDHEWWWCGGLKPYRRKTV